ncbi:MAG: hypothetical protein ACYDDV_06755 [Methanoregula sp.]
MFLFDKGAHWIERCLANRVSAPDLSPPLRKPVPERTTLLQNLVHQPFPAEQGFSGIFQPDGHFSSKVWLKNKNQSLVKILKTRFDLFFLCKVRLKNKNRSPV